MPTNERQLRFLAKAELEPTVQADVWQQAVEQAGNKIPSGRIVKDVVDRIRERTKIPNPHHIGENSKFAIARREIYAKTITLLHRPSLHPLILAKVLPFRALFITSLTFRNRSTG
ncbi:hypothetical protein [Nostoc sp. LEGE 12450]|uniref:hypothetical protein n=1 Tax=Nostoc sp. LEGE 12450 TaxID=1828643 RepID=UPI003A0FC281